VDYNFDAWHIGVIAVGNGAAEALRCVKAALGSQYLVIPRGERTLWAWFGRRRKPTAADFRRLSVERPRGVSLAVGEPRKGIEGWRQTHEEAQAVLPIALGRTPSLTRCPDVLLEAAVLQQKTLSSSLVATFLSPLEDLRYRGQSASDTLCAYFEARRNVSSTANRLGVARNTVESRLREIEQRLGRPLSTCSAQLEVALRLEALSSNPDRDKREPVEAVRLDIAQGRSIYHPNEQSAQTPSATLSTLGSHSLTAG
jgi:transposase-like protein